MFIFTHYSVIFKDFSMNFSAKNSWKIFNKKKI